MNRIPFQQGDTKHFKGIGQRSLRYLPEFSTSNPDKLREYVAKAASYAGTHELMATLGKEFVPEAGSITRADVQLAFALGLRKLTGISLVDAYQRAGRAKLTLLSIDKQTVEWKREEAVRKIAAESGKRLAVDEYHRLSSPRSGWHPFQARMIAAGAPGFLLTVHKNGRAFDWVKFTAVHDAIRSSKGRDRIVDPDRKYGAGNEDAFDIFLRDVLVRDSWVPLEDLILDGMNVPYHEVVWLFDETGEHIGRAIRHTAHGSYLPRLHFTDAEVAQTLATVMKGGYVQRGSSRIAPVAYPMAKPIGRVYELKAGVQPPNAPLDEYDLVRVEPDSIQLVDGLRGGSMSISKLRPGPTVTAWVIDGELVRAHESGWTGSMTSNYLDSRKWLVESQFPRLFPFPAAAGVADGTRPDRWLLDKYEQKVFLPSEALEFHDRMTKLMAREEATAHRRIEQSIDVGELLRYCKSGAGAESVELSATSLVNSLRAEGDASIVEDAYRLAEHVHGRFPELAAFQPLTLWAAVWLSTPYVTPDEVEVGELTLEALMTGLAFVVASSVTLKQVVEHHSSSMAIAVAWWLDDQCSFEAIQDVAAEFDAYSDSVSKQSNRIDQIRLALAEDSERRAQAFERGWAYVTSPIPRSNPGKLALSR